MHSRLYNRAKNYVGRVLELYDLHVQMQSIPTGVAAPVSNLDIRTYRFYPQRSMSTYVFNRQTCDYRLYFAFFDSRPRTLHKPGQYLMSMNVNDIDTQFSTELNSVEQEFQLLMLYNEHEVVEKYIHSILYENRYKFEFETFHATNTDIKCVIPAIKAAKDILNEQKNKNKKQYS